MCANIKTVARYFWGASLIVSLAYIGVVLSLFGTDMFCFGHSKYCVETFATMNNGMKAGAVLTSFSLCTYILVSGMAVFTQRNTAGYISFCIGYTMQLSIAFLMYSIMLHSNDMLLNKVLSILTPQQQMMMFRASYGLGYVMAGVSAIWFGIMIMVNRYVKTDVSHIITGVNYV
jgi:hypothetical protein